MADLTPITREEKIISGEDIKPVTRLEKFLKKFGGGGSNGGGADWNASEGEVGYVKNRTHYDNSTRIYWDGSTDGREIVWTYYVKISDATPTKEEIVGKAIGEIATVFEGNLANLPEDDGIHGYRYLENGNQYFYVVTQPWEPFTAGFYVNKRLITNADFSIGEIKKLDKKFLPDDVGGGATVFYVEDDYLYHDKEATIKVSKDEYRFALSSGVVTIATTDGYSVYYPSYSDFGYDYASVSLWDDGDWWTVRTSEYMASPPV